MWATVLYSSKNTEQLDSILNHELEKVSQWLIANKLSINIKKTKYIIFRSRQKSLNHPNLMIRINNELIERKQSIKFLGVIFDENLSWKEHIKTIASKISRTIGVISKSKFYVSQTSLFKLYHSLVYPYLYYGNIIWGSTYKTNLNRLKILQKRIVRIITKSSYDAHTAPLFHNYHLLNLDNIHTLQVGLFMFTVNSKTIPSIFQSMFCKNSEIHQYATRHSNDYRIQFCRTNINKFSIAACGPKLWNTLPRDLKTNHSLFSFKKKLKKHLLNLSMS